MNLDVKEIKDYFYSNRYNNNASCKYAGMFEKVLQIIDEKDILYFYPKYLFIDEQTLQLYFVLKNNKFIKVWINKDKQVLMEFFSIDKIRRVSYECPLDDYGNYKLILLFEEKLEEIKFNSKEDTNRHWKYKFDKEICNMVKYLANI